MKFSILEKPGVLDQKGVNLQENCGVFNFSQFLFYLTKP